jgi:phosphonate degradation associated HDIG domain protein
VNTIDDVLNLMATHGVSMYGGESVTQLEHALQCATLAEESGASAALIGASFLHDLGHLIERDFTQRAKSGADDLHQYIAIPFLRSLFDEALLAPIRMHVDAKRYLCFSNADYWATLSPISQQSLTLQGGIFSANEATAFINQPYAKDAVQLRQWDDRAKTPGRITPRVEHFSSVLWSCALRDRRRDSVHETDTPLFDRRIVSRVHDTH